MLLLVKANREEVFPNNFNNDLVSLNCMGRVLDLATTNLQPSLLGVPSQRENSAISFFQRDFKSSLVLLLVKSNSEEAFPNHFVNALVGLNCMGRVLDLATTHLSQIYWECPHRERTLPFFAFTVASNHLLCFFWGKQTNRRSSPTISTMLWVL